MLFRCVKDLVHIPNNHHFLSRKTPQYYESPTRTWDIGGDDFGTMDDVVILEIAQPPLMNQK